MFEIIFLIIVIPLIIWLGFLPFNDIIGKNKKRLDKW